MLHLKIASAFVAMALSIWSFGSTHDPSKTKNRPTVNDTVITVPLDSLIQLEFEDKFNEEVNAWILYPIFTDYQKKLAGKNVMIEGFLQNAYQNKDPLYLGTKPHQHGFCSMGDFKVLIELLQPNISESQRKRYLNKKVTLQGTLALNDSLIEKMYYLLEDASLVR